MAAGQLTYDGTTYRLDAAAVADLLERRVIVPDPMVRGQYELSPDHLIAEVEGCASFVGFRAGDDIRGESVEEGRRRMSAVRFQHRDGQGGG